jgi:glutaconyl-CoA/methylmalonyl-CoA decarboxylase subunit gamma
MQIEVTVDGEKFPVEVDLDRGVVRWNGRDVPAKVITDKFGRVELEVAGEKLVVEGWPQELPEPPSPVVLNGEQFQATLRRIGTVATRPVSPAAAPATTQPSLPASTGRGTAVLPPMPGKIVELRVKDGDRVELGQVLLVLEAMKMRNEVTAPVAGRVVDIRVSAGSNVRAREPMLSLVP